MFSGHFARDISPGFSSMHTHSFDKTHLWNTVCYILFRTSYRHCRCPASMRICCKDFHSNGCKPQSRCRTPLTQESDLCVGSILRTFHTESHCFYALEAAERTCCTDLAIFSDSGVRFPSSESMGVSRTALIAPARDKQAATVDFCSGVNNE